MIKNLPAMQGTRVWSLGREDPLENGMATHSSILDRGAWWATVHGVTKSQTRLKRLTFTLSLLLPLVPALVQSQFWYLRLMDACLLGGLLLEDNSEDMYY